MSQHAVWTQGFRPFFLGAIIFAVLAMADWMAVYLLHLQLDDLKLRGGHIDLHIQFLRIVAQGGRSSQRH